jgi:putative hydrolase of the HAD superfamily
LLIIFDLDDTLIDTSGCITPIKLEDAVHRMVNEGLHLPNVSEAIEMIKRLDDSAESARHTLLEFLEIHGAEERFLEIGLKEIYENISSDIPVFPLDQVEEVLSELVMNHQLAIVTMGKKEQQIGKLKKAGIDSAIFSKIVVCEEGSKKPHYQGIAEELSCSSSEVVVCGDRILSDLTPAKELGYKTIHMRWGRGLHISGPKKDVDYTVYQFLIY